MHYIDLLTYNTGYCKTILATLFIISFNCSTSSNSNVIPELAERKRVVRHTDVPNESSHHMASASSDILVQDAEIMDTLTRALKHCDREDVASVYEEIEVEDEGAELDC